MIPNAKGFVGKNSDGAEQIGQRVLRCQAHGQAADGEGGDHGGDVDADVLSGHQHGYDDDEGIEALADDAQQLVVEHAVGLVCGAPHPEIERQRHDF